jgi:AcrR family transcriptional regulator
MKQENGSKDLRVIKTKRAIMHAFNELMKEKSLDKITVTELAQRAEINKGTFYLHYTDLYALYQEALEEHMKEVVEKIPFFEYLCKDPHHFAECIITKKAIRFQLFKDDPYFCQDRSHWNHSIGSYFAEAIGTQAVKKSGLEPTEENKIKMMYLFAGIGPLLHMESEQNHEFLIDLLTRSIYAIFPEAERK